MPDPELVKWLRKNVGVEDVEDEHVGPRDGGPLTIRPRLNNVHTKTPCDACGNWDRPGVVAFFAGDYDAWYCDQCVVAGAEHIASRMRERAARMRDAADELERDAQTGVVIVHLSDADRAQKEAWDRERLEEEARFAAEHERWKAENPEKAKRLEWSSSDLPF